MNTLQVIVFAVFMLEALALGAELLISSTLFKLLQEKHPEYYGSIGRPKAFGNAFPNFDDYLERIKAGAFICSMVFRGIPGNFPADKRAKRLAQIARYTFTGVLALFMVIIIVGYFAFGKTTA